MSKFLIALIVMVGANAFAAKSTTFTMHHETCRVDYYDYTANLKSQMFDTVKKYCERVNPNETCGVTSISFSFDVGYQDGDDTHFCDIIGQASVTTK